jgi:hypothetical protein
MLSWSISLNVLLSHEPKGTEISLPAMPNCFVWENRSGGARHAALIKSSVFNAPFACAEAGSLARMRINAVSAGMTEQQRKPMTTESVMRDAANRAYITAFLLCGGAERAEAAVLESIRLMNSDVASGEELFRGAVHAAIELEDISGQRVGELGLDFSTLPLELQCVLHLPQYPRQCLVLRVLVRLPRKTCARLLRSELNQIEEGTVAGLSELRAIMDKRLRSSEPHITLPYV